MRFYKCNAIIITVHNINSIKIYRISLTVENFEEFDATKSKETRIRFWDERTFWHEIIYKSLIPTNEWLAIRQTFPYKPLSLNVSPMKPTINLSKFYSSNFCE